MVFSNLVFLFAFFPLFLLCYFIVPNRAYRNIILLVFSLAFYAWGEPLYIILMIYSIIFNYVVARLIEKSQIKGNSGRVLLAFAVLVNLLLIGVYKYADFFIGIVNAVFGLSINPVNLPLPIGISFYTFQILSYVIDVYRREVPAQKNVLFLGAYLSAFPQLIAGPIVRYQTVAEELISRRETMNDFAYGVRRFVAGLSKKVLIANNMAVVADTLLARSGNEYGCIGAWIAVFAYTMQIYFDFSGYSDMAIGMGRMLGFHFLENFNYPYIAKSVTDFWRRWHISLSTFFRDYVYIPLGGNRVKKPRYILNIMIVWMLTGLWHGANWNFVLWGLYYGILLLIEKLFVGKLLEKCPAVVRHAYTIFIFMMGWVLFRAESFAQIKEIVGAMFGASGTGNFEFFVYTQVLNAKNIIVAIAAIMLSFPFIPWLKARLEKTLSGKIMVDAAVIGLFVLCVLMLEVGSYNPFIYFRF